MVDPDMNSVVIDNGSRVVKCGFADGDSEAPRCVFPSIVGRPYKSGIEKSGMGPKDYIVGSAAIDKHESLDLKFPVEHGIVVHWGEMEILWYHIFYNELKCVPEEHPVLLTEIPFNPKNNREKSTSIMFELFNVPAMFLSQCPVLSLYASGRTTGVVLDSGACVTHVVPIYEGYGLCGMILRMNIAGNNVTEYLGKILSEKGYELKSFSEKLILEEIKEKYGYVAQDFESELIKAETGDSFVIREFELPDKTKIELGPERFEAAEVLFKPSLIGSEMTGIDGTLFNSIQKCDIGIRKDLYQNLVLSGGSTMFEGLTDRLHKELVKRAPRNARVKVNAPHERRFSTFYGGAILSSLSTFQEQWITKDEYDDAGATIVHRKCF